MREDEDPKHYKHMISFGPPTILRRLIEDELGWTFGGALRLRKSRPYFDDAGYVHPLHPGSRFYKVPFSTPFLGDATKEIFGLALWFEKIPMEPQRMGQSITLCGWVPTDREKELDQWIEFLNSQITLRLAESPVGSADRRMQASLAGIEGLGVSVPRGKTLEEVMASLEAMAKKERS